MKRFEMGKNYDESFVKKYGELMSWRGALKFARDSLSRALYSGRLLGVIESIKGNESWEQAYESLTQREEDISLNSLEQRCNQTIELWREEEITI